MKPEHPKTVAVMPDTEDRPLSPYEIICIDRYSTTCEPGDLSSHNGERLPAGSWRTRQTIASGLSSQLQGAAIVHRRRGKNGEIKIDTTNAAQSRTIKESQ